MGHAPLVHPNKVANLLTRNIAINSRNKAFIIVIVMEMPEQSLLILKSHSQSRD